MRCAQSTHTSHSHFIRERRRHCPLCFIQPYAWMAPAAPKTSMRSPTSRIEPASSTQTLHTGTGSHSAPHTHSFIASDTTNKKTTVTVTVTIRPATRSTTTTFQSIEVNTSRVMLLPPIPSVLPAQSAHPTADTAGAGARIGVVGPVLGGLLVGALLLYIFIFCLCQRRRRRVQEAHPFQHPRYAEHAVERRDAAVSPRSEKVQRFSGMGMGTWVPRTPARVWLERDSDIGYSSPPTLRSLSALVSPKERMDASRMSPRVTSLERNADLIYSSNSALQLLNALTLPKETVDAPWPEESETLPDYVSTIQGLGLGLGESGMNSHSGQFMYTKSIL